MQGASLSLRDWRSFLPPKPLRHLFCPQGWDVTGITGQGFVVTRDIWPPVAASVQTVQTTPMLTFVW